MAFALRRRLRPKPLSAIAVGSHTQRLQRRGVAFRAKLVNFRRHSMRLGRRLAGGRSAGPGALGQSVGDQQKLPTEANNPGPGKSRRRNLSPIDRTQSLGVGLLCRGTSPGCGPRREPTTPRPPIRGPATGRRPQGRPSTRPAPFQRRCPRPTGPPTCRSSRRSRLASSRWTRPSEERSGDRS